ncbi:N-acetylglucosamine-6-phosphate deacetylase [Fictibacillus aquaticus]|uniref:N-acetylglucosamine-6-phosphate deacetylase n=1 Tax=Fictibacillus aquaticus TaxID=2021314 RepID=A0A235F4K4_9BACL|nr:N-acetylglucosamine-6-phosphate deacetylase [Fictibacillus aquaticus]OYD56162.1 N-acetylglucosamine-6-phosphate deacetylase [Fictibacillus aquaticus]
MAAKLLFKGEMVTSDGIKSGFLLTTGETILYVGEIMPKDLAENVVRIDIPENAVLMPGMIDLHIHGAAGADVMDGTEEALQKMCAALPAEGTTSFLATTMTEKTERIEAALQNTAQYMEKQQAGYAEILGIHLEGPFISPKRAGAQPKEYIVPPNVEQFKQWNEIAEKKIKLVTLAPEEPGGYELASFLKDNRIIASIGHSDAVYEDVMKSVEAGVTHATHLYNGMRGMHHRDPGTAGGVMLRDEITAEIIADGIHSDGEMVKLAYKLKGSDKLVLITDAMRAKCLGEGMYTLGGQDVTVRDGTAVLKDGTLAGSVLKMNDAVKNMRQFTSCSIEEIVKMTSENPAKELGIYSSKGSLEAGKDADLVMMSKEGEVLAAFCRGKKAFEKGVS